MTITLNVPGYAATEQLYSGSRTLVYRATRQADRQPIVIKLLRNEHPSFGELVQFRNQYTLSKNLTAPGIIQPLGLEPHRNGYALVMEDFGGISLRQFTQGKPLTVDEFCPIALQLTDILHYLYYQRIIHKDIKPANILIHPETRQIKLIDFSIASLLPREIQEIQNANSLEGTLAYLSPEQTGRMNRGIDYRSDFYSFGVTCYELLTGQLPFVSDDPIELVHCHLAKQPALIHSLNPNLPPILSEIVAKLMAKNAEDRYQSALGLRHDLERCWTQWQEQGNLIGFRLGERDICDRFLIPERLYGRETEVMELLSAFNRVSAGAAELLLVAGFSGIGKTAVVNEVHKPIARGARTANVRQRGYFIKGKYDQFNRDLPFSAFVQAFQDLIGQLLSESDAQLAHWKAGLLEALGENAQVIIEVIPELERVIGPQPPAPELFGIAVQNRFNLLFQKFIQIFTTADHPLVMFLDDLQWADSASLNLMQGLISQQSLGYLLLIGAYRDHEVFPAHPLMLTLDQVEKAGATLKTLTLAPLTASSVNQLVAATLSCSEALAQPLTELVYQKTQGNPFFTTQFLKALHQDQLITFVPQAGYWQGDITQLQAAALTDDVVELMSLQLQKLPATTQTVLQLAACIGNQFDLATLAIVCAPGDRAGAAQSLEATAVYLWQALQAGLIIPQSQVYKFFGSELLSDEIESIQQSSTTFVTPSITYKFLHDRVQQAAYSLIPDHQKAATHLKIGRLLRQATSGDQLDEQIFAIVNHLNKGRSLIAQPQEQQELSELNLTAGRKAIAATAYRAAADYATVSLELLTENCWVEQYDLTLALHNLAAAAHCSAGNFAAMAQLAEQILSHAQTLLDVVEVYEIRIRAFAAQSQPLEAAETTLETMRLLGVDVPQTGTNEAIGAALQSVAIAIGDRQPTDLLDQPAMTNPHFLAALNIFSTGASPVYIARPDIYPLFVLKAVELSAIHGAAPASCYAYANYGILLAGVVGDSLAAYAFGQLAIDLLSRHPSQQFKARTLFVAYAFTPHWKVHLRETLPLSQQTYAAGLETGDTLNASYGICCYASYACFVGQNLADLSQAVEHYANAVGQLNQQACHAYLRLYQQLLANLTEVSDQPACLQGAAYDERQMLPLHLAGNDYYGLATLFLSKLVLAYLFQEFQLAAADADAVAPLLGAILAMPTVPVFCLYDSLTQLALWPDATPDQQQGMNDRVAGNQAKMQAWAIHAPMNFLHKFHLVEAERARVRGDRGVAMEHYDQAIALAKEHQYLNEEALAHELAARFYLEWGKERMAQSYLIDAYYAYSHWGAKAKVADLEQRYPQLLGPILQQQQPSVAVTDTIFSAATLTASLSTSSRITEVLDLATVLKVSQMLSSEIESEKLLEILLQVMLEHAGAEKCVLLRADSLPNPGNERLVVEGMAIVGSQPVMLQPIPVEQSQEVPLSLIYQVKHSLEPIVLINGVADPKLANDPYILRHQTKSILCIPIVNRGRFVGILYLENNLTTGAFTRDRVELLNLLCAQAAISLENAHLYQQSQQALAVIEEKEENLRLIIDGVQDYSIIRLSPEGTIVTWNPGSARIKKYTADEIIGQHFSVFYTPEDRQRNHPQEVLTQAIEQGRYEEEGWRMRKDGRFWAHVDITALRDQAGELRGFSKVTRDITQRKQLEDDRKSTAIDNARLYDQSQRALAKLQDSETRFQTMTSNLPGIVYQIRIGPDGTVSTPYVSSACVDLYEVSPEDFLAGVRNFREMEHPDDRATITQAIIHSAQTFAPFKQEFRIITPSGKVKWVQVESQAQPQSDGSIVFDGVKIDITDRKQAEKTLQLTQFSIDHACWPVWWVQPSGQIAYANEAACRDLGYSKAEILQRYVWDFDINCKPEHWDRNWQSVKAQGFYHFETQNIDRAGTIYPVEVTLDYIELEGEAYQSAIVRNISDRKQAEADLRDSEAKFRSIIENAQDVIFILNPDGTFFYLSPSWQEILGYGLNEMVNQPFAPFIHPDDLHICTDTFTRLLDGETKIKTPEYRVLHRDGSHRWFITNVSSIKDSAGRMLYAIGMSYDNTDRKQAEAALQQQEQFLRSIYNGAEMVIFVVDILPGGSFCYAGWNRIAEQLTGIQSVDAVGKTLIEIHGAVQGERLHQRFTEIVSTETSFSYEECLTFKGQEVWFFVNLNPITDQAGRVYRIIGTTFDITDRKRAEAELNQRSVELENTLQELQRTQTQMIQSEKMSGLGQLVAGVAHEINNPVNFIFGNLSHADAYTQDLLGLVELYQQHYSDPHPEIQEEAAAIDLEFLTEDLPKLLSSMKVGADRIKAIVASLRNFSRMDEAEMKSVDIHDGINSTLMILQHRFKSKSDSPGIEIVKSYGQLPLIECYAGQLNQVFMNLLSNAIDALEESLSARRVTVPTITIRTRLVNARQVMIQITDNGSGIPESIKPRLFDPFFTTKPVGKGTGMGLSISYQIVTEKHQGTLKCVSAPGQGTTFTVTIPIQQT